MNTASDWIVLVDDDTYLNIPRLNIFLKKMELNRDMLIGHVLTPFHCLWGGAGMILSNSAFYWWPTNGIRSNKGHLVREYKEQGRFIIPMDFSDESNRGS